LPSPVNIPDFFQISGGTWNSAAEDFVRARIDEGCGAELGPGCVDYVAVVESNPEVVPTVDCPVNGIHIPRPLYDVDVPGTPHRDDLITITINDRCDGVVADGAAPDPGPASGAG
jgi:hypothetical protein